MTENTEAGLREIWTQIVVQMVKNLPAVKEIWVPSLGGKDPLEKGISIHFSILTWRIPWTEEPDELVHGVAKSWV